MKQIILLLVTLSVHSLALSEWTVDANVDAMTDEEKKTAIVKNELGHTFSIYRVSKGGPVWGNFALSEKMFDQVDWKKPPMYRIDKNKPNDLASMKMLHDLGVQAYSWEPKWINFLMWHGKEDEGLSENLVNLMEGEKVVFRYHLSTGGYKDTTFSLEGAASAIAEAIGILANIDHAAEQQFKEYRQAIINETNKCRGNISALAACNTRVTECSSQANQDIEMFKSCMQ